MKGRMGSSIGTEVSQKEVSAKYTFGPAFNFFKIKEHYIYLFFA